MADKTHSSAQIRYNAKAFDKISFDVHKGKKALYKAGAEACGMGFMDMMRTAIETFIEEHAGKEFVRECEPPKEKPSAGVKLSEQEQLLLTRFDRLPQETKDVVLNLVGEAARVANKGAA